MTHLCTTKRPMSEARRQTIHGPLQALIENRPTNEPHPLVGALLLIALFAVLPFAVALFS